MLIGRVLSGEQQWHVEHGDSLTVLRSMPDACVDAIVTDPPAGIGFMGKEWDDFRRSRNPGDVGRDSVFGRTSARGPELGRRDRDKFIAFLSEILAECYRVTKPGGRMLCWSIPRTMHWTGCAIEDAGWEVENTVAHIFGSGFPKAKSQLKPAREDWWLARKPAKNVLPLNIDECRVSVSASDDIHAKNPHTLGGFGHGDASVYGESSGASAYDPTAGRWPANLVLSHGPGCRQVGTKQKPGDSRPGGGLRPGGFVDTGAPKGAPIPVSRGYAGADGKETVEDWCCEEGCPIAELDSQSGITTSGAMKHEVGGYEGESFTSFLRGRSGPSNQHGGTGGASRFFNTFEAELEVPFIYLAKASKADRNSGDVVNKHPTVKPTPLMRHLCKLITPPGGIVLDPFTGSGSTGRGSVLEGFRFIGIEMSDTEAEPYVTIARSRIAQALSQTPFQNPPPKDEGEPQPPEIGVLDFLRG
jgi:site-specific DNA-methyltransferase (adenine-specific)